MAADLLFFDTSYLVRLYLDDGGFEAVRGRAGAGRAIASAWHAQAEVIAAMHRAFRERGIEPEAFALLIAQFIKDGKEGGFCWLSLTDGVQQRIERVVQGAPATVFLRAADALHLACAAENGFTEVYSNDRRFLDAAPLFGLRGINLIPEKRQ
jgi:predicted nucleic acid-binding protein